MSFPLRYATAGQVIPLGPFLDSTDGDSPEAGLTINASDIKVWKKGATALVNKNSGGATAMAGGSGVYYTTLDATDTNTYGSLFVYVHVSGALSEKLECCVYPPNYYDACYAGTEWLQVDAMRPDFTVVGSTLTVKKPDDVTTAYTKGLGTSPSAEPIVSST